MRSRSRSLSLPLQFNISIKAFTTCWNWSPRSSPRSLLMQQLMCLHLEFSPAQHTTLHCSLSHSISVSLSVTFSFFPSHCLCLTTRLSFSVCVCLTLCHSFFITLSTPHTLLGCRSWPYAHLKHIYVHAPPGREPFLFL